MNLNDIIDGVKSRVGTAWVAANQIEDSIIREMALDEMQKLAADAGTFEGSFTAVGDDTNNFIVVNEDIFYIKGIWYDYVSNVEWGDKLTEVASIEPCGKLHSRGPTVYYLQGMHRVNAQRIYFDFVMPSTTTVRGIFYKWADEPSADDTQLEMRRLWVKAVKEVVASQVARMGASKEANIVKRGVSDSMIAAYNDTMRVINRTPKRPLVGITGVYRDMG